MMNINVIILFFGLFAIAFAKIELDGEVLVLTDDNFQEALTAYESILVEFYAPWCGHCKSLAPEWTKAAKALKSSTMKLAKVDATENRGLAETNAIKGFPTIKYFKNGKFSSDYNGGRKEADIVSWSIKKTGAATTTLTSVADLENFQKDKTIFAIGLFTSLDSPAAKSFGKLAGDDERISYALTSSKEVMAKLDVTKDMIIIVKDFDEKRSELEVSSTTNEDEIKNFLIGYSTPLVQEFSGEAAKNIFASPIQKHALFFTDKDAEHHTPVLEAMTEIAKLNRGRMLFVNVPSTEKKVAEFFGVSDDKLPVLYIADMASESGLKKYSYTGDLTSITELSTFVESFFHGDLSPHLKSEEVTPEDTQGPVVIAKGTSFKDIVINNSKDIFVEFYAPWCGHCKKLAPIWDELGEKFEGNDNVVIAKMDATANEVDIPGLNVQGFPSIFFFKGNDKSNPIKYEEGRELSDFVNFLEKNAHHTIVNDEL